MKNYSDKRYVFIDTETGGIIPGKHSLLSIGIVIWEKDYGIIDKKEFYDIYVTVSFHNVLPI